MAAGLASLLLAVTGPDFVESRIEPGTRDFSYELHDIDGDGRDDVLVSLRRDRRRELWVHLQRESSFTAEPDWRWTDVPEDITAFACFDVRDEPGAELVLLTATGIFSVSPSRASLRGNLRRELTMPLFPDLAPSGALRRWPWVLDADGDGKDDLLVVSGDELHVLRRPAEEGLTRGASLPLIPERASSSMARIRFGSGGIGLRGSTAAPRHFPGLATSLLQAEGEDLLTFERGHALPLWLDWNLDGRPDAVRIDGTSWQVWRQQADGGFADATLVELPAALTQWWEQGEDNAPDVKLADLDGDGRREVLVSHKENDETVAMLWGQGGDGSLSAAPLARLKFAELQTDFRLTDVDRDGRTDLVVWTFDVPRNLTALRSLEARVALLAYPFRDGTLAREPALRVRRTFSPESLGRIAETLILDLSGDFNADGLCDLLQLRPDGLLEIYPLRAEGSGWVTGGEPLAQYLPREAVRRAVPCELSGDRTSDLILVHERSLTLFVSRPERNP